MSLDSSLGGLGSGRLAVWVGYPSRYNFRCAQKAALLRNNQADLIKVISLD